MRKARTQDVTIVPAPAPDGRSGCARPLACDSTRLGGCAFPCSVCLPSKVGSRSVVITVPPDGKDLIVARYRLMIEPKMDYTAAATLRRFPYSAARVGSLGRRSFLLPHESPELGVRILFDASRWYPCAERRFRCQVLPGADAAEISRAAGLARRATSST